MTRPTKARRACDRAQKACDKAADALLIFGEFVPRESQSRFDKWQEDLREFSNYLATVRWPDKIE